MYLGLDLRGGIHFLMEVDMDAAVAQAEERNFNDIRALLREEKLRYKGATRNPDTGIRLRFKDDETRQQALALIREDFEDLDLIEADPGEHLMSGRGLPTTRPERPGRARYSRTSPRCAAG